MLHPSPHRQCGPWPGTTESQTPPVSWPSCCTFGSACANPSRPQSRCPKADQKSAWLWSKSGAMVPRLLRGMGHGKFMKAISLKKCRYSKSSEVQGTKTAGLVWNFCIGPSIRLARIQKVCRHCDIKKPQGCFQVKTPLISHDFKWVMGSFTSGRPHQPTLALWILISTINQLG